jgi:gamma-glutamylputrescine oxidase
MTDQAPYTFYAATAISAQPKRPRLLQDVDTTVCVIGGGFAGLWTARALAKRGYDVVLLEGRRVAGEASGRSGGFVSAGFAERLPRIIERVGIDDARALYKLSRDGIDIVNGVIAQGVPGVVPVPGRLHVQRFDGEDRLRREADLLGAVFDHEMLVWKKERVRETLLTRRYFQALHDADAFSIHPLNLALALAKELEDLGVSIFEDTAVIGADLGGVRKVIVTSAGKVRAHQVVFCGSAFIGEAFPELARTILPVATHVAVTAPIGDTLRELIRYSGGISDTRRAHDYYRVLEDGRLLWGGRITTRTKSPKKLNRKMLGDIVRVYPQLKGTAIEYAWTGIMGYAIHKMPQIGLLQPGVWINSAFGGHGLNTTAMGAELVASAISEHDDRWRLFIPFGLVWAGGGIGRRATQLIYGSMKFRDWMQERAALRRERRADRRALRDEKRRIRAAERGVKVREKAEQHARTAALDVSSKAETEAAVERAVEAAKEAVNEKTVSQEPRDKKPDDKTLA